MAKEKKAKELKDKKELQAKELKEKRDAEKLAIQVRSAAAANAAVGPSAVATVRGGASGDPTTASRPPGKQPTRVESSELARTLRILPSTQKRTSGHERTSTSHRLSMA